MTNNKEVISSFFKKIKPSLFPIKDHPLENSEEYSKEIYITMLYTIAGIDGEIDESKKNFIERLTKGIGLNGESSKYIKRALSIDEEILSEFLKLFSGNELAHNFFVDSMVLIGNSGNISEKSIEIISEYAEVLKIKKEEVQSLTHISVVILERNKDEYCKWLEEKSEKIKTKNLLYYIKEFVTGRIIKEKDYEYWFGKFEITESEVIERKNIEIEDAEITLSENSELQFKSCNNIEIRNSKLCGYNGLNIKNSRNLKIKDSKFENFKLRALYIECIEELYIENSEFINCSYTNSKDVGGGAVCIENIKNTHIYKSRFENCVTNIGKSTTNISASIFRYNFNPKGAAIFLGEKSIYIENTKLIENTFINCNGYDIFGKIDRSIGAIGGDCDLIMYEDEILKENKFQNCSVGVSY